MLSVSDLAVSYGAIKAVKGISFDIDEGEIVTLIGANGAGKSTTLNTIAGLIKPDSGSIKFSGEELVGIKPHKIVERGLALCPEGRRVFTHMTVAENLDMGGYTRTDAENKETLELVYEHFPRLKERMNQVAGTLSGGEQQMLAMGRALMSRPKLLMLDEPSMGLAPILVDEIFEIIQALNKNGTTILLVEQNANMALKVAARGYVLETGKIVKTGTGAELLLVDDDVRKALSRRMRQGAVHLSHCPARPCPPANCCTRWQMPLSGDKSSPERGLCRNLRHKSSSGDNGVEGVQSVPVGATTCGARSPQPQGRGKPCASRASRSTYPRVLSRARLTTPSLVTSRTR